MPVNPPSQTESGMAWEYALARELAAALLLPASKEQLKECRPYGAYQALPADDKGRLMRAAQAAVKFLLQHDPELAEAQEITFQSRSQAQAGDVRDILASTPDGDIGMSAKHRHSAIRHSRLSGTIDFGQEWYGVPCSEQYWATVKPVFENLRQLQQQGRLWEDMAGETYRLEVYRTVLAAFIREVKEHARSEQMMRYLLGQDDFYKVIKANGHVKMESFNLSGSLCWGDRMRLPTQLIEAVAKPGSRSTALIFLDDGWALSMRLHTASSRVEPSLKFDAQLLGAPSALSRHQISLG